MNASKVLLQSSISAILQRVCSTKSILGIIFKVQLGETASDSSAHQVRWYLGFAELRDDT